MRGHDNVDAHFSGPLHDRLEIIHLEPQQHTVAIWLVITIANRSVMVFHFEAVQLKNKLAVRDQLLIRGASMIAQTTQQTPIPPAAGFYVSNGDERLGAHSINISTLDLPPR